MSKKRTYSDDIRSTSSNSRKSSNGSIEIHLDTISYRDSRSYSIDSRSYSIDSNCSSIAGSFEEKKILLREKQDNSPLFEIILNSEKKSTPYIKRRERDTYLKKALLDEPKTAEEVKKYLSIFKKQ